MQPIKTIVAGGSMASKKVRLWPEGHAVYV